MQDLLSGQIGQIGDGVNQFGVNSEGNRAQVGPLPETVAGKLVPFWDHDLRRVLADGLEDDGPGQDVPKPTELHVIGAVWSYNDHYPRSLRLLLDRAGGRLPDESQVRKIEARV